MDLLLRCNTDTQRVSNALSHLADERASNHAMAYMKWMAA